MCTKCNFLSDVERGGGGGWEWGGGGLVTTYMYTCIEGAQHLSVVKAGYSS